METASMPIINLVRRVPEEVCLCSINFCRVYVLLNIDLMDINRVVKFIFDQLKY